MSRYFDEDAEASSIAEGYLRGMSDEALEWIPHLSSIHMDLVCDYLKTIPHVLLMAGRYEAARRRAFPEIGGNDVADGRVRSTFLQGDQTDAPYPSRDRSPVRSEAAAPGNSRPRECRPAAVNSELAGNDVGKGEAGTAGYPPASPSHSPHQET